MPETRMRRPVRVTLFAWIVLGLVAWNAIRFMEGLRYGQVLAEYRARPGPVYIAAGGAFWLVCGLALAYGLLKGRTWAWPAACAFTPGYALWYWLDRLLAQGPRPTWPFALGVTGLLLAVAGFSLLTRRTLRFFHREAHERKPQTPAAS